MKNTKFILFAFSICLFFTACSGPESPVFIEMKDVKVEDVRSGQIYLSGNAIFKNPNPVAGKLVKTDIDVVVNEIEVGKISQDLSTEIKANSEFVVPVKVNFPMKKVFENKKGLIKGLMNALLDQKAMVSYKGSVTINFLKIDFETPIEYEEEVSLKE